MEASPTTKDHRGVFTSQGADGVKEILRKVTPFTPGAKEAGRQKQAANPEPPPVEPTAEPKQADPDEWAIPANVFPVPAGGISLTNSAKIIFPVLAASRKVFMRGGKPAEVSYENGAASLTPLTEDRLQNVLENCGYSIRRREIGTGKNEGTIFWRKTLFPVGSCRSIMENDQAKIHLPTIKSLASCPIMAKGGEILGTGFHKHCGGVFITKGKTPPTVPFEAARQALWDLLGDFHFTTPPDKSRAIASLISPGLKMGGWIDDDFPLDIAEADKSQSGKTYRQKIIQRIYNDEASGITPKTGGVGSVDESISTVLIAGRPFILLDNFRGRVDSPILESAIRGAGNVLCRALRTSATVDTRHFLWQLSTNGAELTRDLANRSIITRIRKQPDGYKFKSFPEGALEAHVIANQPFFLGCVFSIICKWNASGCPSTSEHRHTFQGWCQALDWIVQNLFGCPPLLDGHREEQNRVGNPDMQWLREVILSAKQAHHDRDLNTGDLLTIAEDAGISFPGNQHSKDEPSVQAGRIFGRLFRASDGGGMAIDGFVFSRESKPDYSENGGGRSRNFYTISKA